MASIDVLALTGGLQPRKPQCLQSQVEDMQSFMNLGPLTWYDNPSYHHSSVQVSADTVSIWRDTQEIFAVPSSPFSMALLGSSLIQKLFSSKATQCEKKKTIIDTTFDRAIWRGLIHLLSISVSNCILGS